MRRRINRVRGTYAGLPARPSDRREGGPIRRLVFILSALAALAAGTLVCRAAAPAPLPAEPLSEETRRLLEQSLSVVEIDREIGRIAAKSEQTQQAIDRSAKQLAAQEIAIAARREQAGRVLRAYYMGQRDMLWSALLSARSLPDLLRLLETVQLLVRADHDALSRYARDYDQLKNGYLALERDKAELSRIESELRAQRERVAKLQEQLDTAVSASGQADRLRKLMEELQQYWNSVGLYEVSRNFQALAEAMQGLPDWVQKHPGMLSTSGLNATLTMTDDQMNAFLRSRDSRFDAFEFRFAPDLLTLEGTSGGLSIRVQGHYTVQDEPENGLYFHIDHLYFNGLELPDTTRADLERRFDLGFYPQKLVPYLKADSIRLEDGKLTVGLKFGK